MAMEPQQVANCGEEGIPLHHRHSQIPCSPPGPRNQLTDGDKRQLYRDGFIILRGAIPRELTERARRLWNVASTEERVRLGTRSEITDLVTKSCVRELLRREMGEFSPPVAGQVAVTPPSKFASAEELRPSDKRPQWPQFGFPDMHVEGEWTGPTPKRAELNVETGKPFDVERFLGDESAHVTGDNGGPLWQDEAKTLSLGSFTTFVIVALNNQIVPGRGQTAVIRGGHHEVQKFLRWQRDQGGPIGPEGPGWPRFSPIGKDGVTITFLPEAVRKASYPDGAVQSADGIWWPKPTPILMEEGDVCLTVHSLPHGASYNFGPDPRMNIIFRVRRFREGDPNEGTPRQATGLSDHPDRAFFGKLLDYPVGYDAFKISREKLCDPWSEWQGMDGIIAQERAKEGTSKL